MVGIELGILFLPYATILRKEIFMKEVIGTFIVLVILVAIVCVVVRSMIRDKKSGKSLQCGGDCSKCKGCH